MYKCIYTITGQHNSILLEYVDENIFRDEEVGVTDFQNK
jgi:hypothetical protein